MCTVCRRSLLAVFPALALPTSLAVAQGAPGFERIPVSAPLCAAPNSRARSGELRIYGSRADIGARRSFRIGTREFALLRGSGDPSLDEVLGEALSDILNRLEFGAHQVPAVFFIDDGDLPNAFAWSASIRHGTTGTLALGTSMLRNMIALGGSAVRAILVHEAAHLYQFMNRLEMGESARDSQRRELQADYVAGWELARWLGASPAGLGHARIAANAMISIGVPSNLPPDQATHGNANQRFRAFMEGWIDGAAGAVVQPRAAFAKGSEVAWRAVG
jgi:hypothetical protein